MSSFQSPIPKSTALLSTGSASSFLTTNIPSLCRRNELFSEIILTITEHDSIDFLELRAGTTKELSKSETLICSEMDGMDENEWKWLEMDGDGRKWMKMERSRWKWNEVDGSG